ncbi:hypothetical protein TFLX_00748 [Thermoflexales bacterium]|nr:hypothetical protein TFLX_00748 [Thermoflexales bacterium]
MIDTTSLDAISRQILGLFVNAYPDWEQHVALEPDDSSVAFIELSSPGPLKLPLFVTFADEEVTIVFDKYHRHFGWAGQSPNEIFVDAQSFLERFFREEVLVGIRMEGDIWQESLTLTPKDLDVQPPFDVTYTRSWCGTYDRNWDRTVA